MFEYLGICLPAIRLLLTLVLAGSVLGAAACWALWWISGPAGDRKSGLLERGAALLVAAWLPVAGMAFVLGEPGRSCPKIQETYSMEAW